MNEQRGIGHQMIPYTPKSKQFLYKVKMLFLHFPSFRSLFFRIHFVNNVRTYLELNSHPLWNIVILTVAWVSSRTLWLTVRHKLAEILKLHFLSFYHLVNYQPVV